MQVGSVSGLSVVSSSERRDPIDSLRPLQPRQYNKVVNTPDEEAIKVDTNAYSVNGSRVQKEAAESLKQSKSKKSEEKALAEAIKAEQERKAQEKEEVRNAEALRQAKALIAELNQKQLALRFERSKDFDADIINVIDTRSDEVVRQIPSEDLLRVSAAIDEYQKRLAHNDMVTDPQLKAKGVDTNDVNENLRGVIMDEIA